MPDRNSNIQDEFKPWTDLKARLRKAGLTVRDLVAVLHEAPSTISARLNGYMRFPQEMRKRLEAFLTERDERGE